jgi:dihydrofolate synthase/folylpolyglutamate synthase
MVQPSKQIQVPAKGIPTTQRNYNEVVEFLDVHWSGQRTEKNSAAFKALDKALGHPGKDLSIITIGGTNGKGLTINFTAQLLKQEGFNVGALYSPHILTYN